MNKKHSGDRPRALFVLSSTNRRGAEIQAMTIATGLANRGFDIRTAALAPGTHGDQLDVPTLGPTARSLATLRALRRGAHDVDVVVAYGSSTLPACALALFGTGVPFVYRNIGDPGDWVRGRIHQARTGVLMRRAAHVAALWPGAAESITKLYGVRPAHVSVISNARDSQGWNVPNDDERSAARARFAIPSEASCVALIGALAEEKQFDVALRAIARLPATYVVVAGDGPSRQQLEELSQTELPDRVQFLGQIADVRVVLHAADVVVLSSRTEGLPGILIEAAYCGVPAVATDVGGVREIIDDSQTGRVVAAGDVESLAKAIIEVLGRRDQMGRAARERCIDRFDIGPALAKWEALLRTVSR